MRRVLLTIFLLLMSLTTNAENTATIVFIGCDKHINVVELYINQELFREYQYQPDWEAVEDITNDIKAYLFEEDVMSEPIAIVDFLKPCKKSN